MTRCGEQPGVAEGRTFTSLLAEGLLVVLQQRPSPARMDPLPTFGDPGQPMLVDILDRDAVWAALDAG